MLLAADPYSAIDVDKLVGWLIAQSEQSNGCPESFCLVDVNDFDVYIKNHIANAYHYDRIMLARLIYETPILAQARAEGHLLVIYGREAERVAKVLFQRGFKTVLLKGNIPLFKEQYPCLLEPSIDFVKLKEIYERKKNSVFGGRLWRSTSASRLKSVGREERAEKTKKLNSRPSSQSRKPWL